MQKLIEQGQWSDNISWKLYASDTLPKLSLITAVFCVAIHNEKIILMRAERGWGMIGGHIELGETPVEALTRESQEEGGFTPENPQLFGYREITAKVPIDHPSNDTTYPYPTSYIVYYWANSAGMLTYIGHFDFLAMISECQSTSPTSLTVPQPITSKASPQVGCLANFQKSARHRPSNLAS